MHQCKPQECTACEPHLATRQLSRNTKEGTTRTLCAQHKCRPQGGGQSTTALVADLVVAEIQVRQRRICLVKIARTFHGAAWSTSLKHVDNHVSPTTLDAKLIELLHSMPCPARRGLCGHGKITSTPVSRQGISYHVMFVSRACGMYSHHLNTSPKTCGGVLREVKTRHRSHPTPTHPMPSRAASHLCTSEAKHTGITEDDETPIQQASTLRVHRDLFVSRKCSSSSCC